MNTAQLRRATAEFDAELPTGADGLPGRPMNRDERRKWNKVRKKMGRPRVGKGSRRVMISLESDLLRRTDAFAKRHALNRSQMVAAGLLKLMAG